MFVATLLVLLDVFGEIQLAVLLVLVAACSWAVGLRRSSLSRHARAVRDECRAEPLVLLGFAVVLVVAAVWAAVPLLPSAGGWRYWADGLELADAGGIPDFTSQWGEALPPAVSKVGGNAFLGALSFLFREEPFTGMAVALWLSAVGYAAGLFALAYELGLRWTAALVPILGMAAFPLPGSVTLSTEVAHKLEFFQHEDLGRMLAAVGASIVLAGAEWRPSRLQALAGGAVLAAAGLTHLVPLVVFAGLIAGVLLARLALGPLRRELAVFATIAFLSVASLVAVPLVLARGEVGFSGATEADQYQLVEGRYDPTARMKGLTLPPRPKDEARWYESPSTTARQAAEGAVGRSLDGIGAAVLAALVVALAVAVLVWGTLELRLLSCGALVLAAWMVAAALFFSFHYSLWVQATFGQRRLFEYASLPLILIAGAGLELLAQRLGQRWRVAGRALAAGAVAAALIASIGDLGPTDKRGSLRYVAAAATTPCDSRLLLEHVSRGTFQSLAGRISVTEGLVPFLRPTVLNDVLALRGEARAFFTDPESGAGFLAREEVDYVLSTGRGALDRAPSLRLVGEVQGVNVYEVRLSQENARLPDADESPGYYCVRNPPTGGA